MKKEAFFAQMENLGLALTYDDVRLRSGYSEVMPSEVSTASKFSRRIPLNVPIVSAAMDTVTEHALATEMACLGGLGIVHRNMSEEQQAQEIARVKKHLNGLIESPTCVFEDESVEDVMERRDIEELPFHSFPVLSRDGKLVGVLTQNDFDFCERWARPVREIMTTQVITAREGTSIEKAYDIMKQHKKKLLPVVDAEHRVKGLYIFSDVMRVKSGLSKQYNLDARGQLHVGAALGTGESSLLRAEKLVEARVDVLVIDTAHADSLPVFETLRAIKNKWSHVDVVVGNISEPESVKRLLDAGADGIKVGQGPGSICTTRVIAGIGSPQVSAVYRCAKAADGSGVPICADGGLRFSGDITIAMGAGAHNVMMGSMLAGTDESPGQRIFLSGRQWKHYRGMGSLGAMTQHKASRERYRQTSERALVPEGVEGLVAYKGSLRDVLSQYIGGLRAGMGYVGAADIEELRSKAQFHRVTAAGQHESHPHDIRITEESPNYPGSSLSNK